MSSVVRFNLDQFKVLSSRNGLKSVALHLCMSKVAMNYDCKSLSSCCGSYLLNPLPNNKILGLTKLKGFTNNN